MQKKRIAVFASGSGTNAERIIRYFRDKNDAGAEVALVVCNRPDAAVLTRAAALGVPVELLGRQEICNREVMDAVFDRYGIDMVVLAGFLLMVPDFVIARFRGRIVNIHPSLLPRFGGKGMYGRRVHEAVVAAGERVSGITVHMVSERYDEGRILFQASVEVLPTDTAADVERKVHELEYRHYPEVIERLLPF
ncbi:MAG: phosphoribosylglycinamide formyltransferase [Muribaculaceae bacterium]|nr:phosphoribosylglycinamide formyltransferase [Muribaculaceae bacterium]